MEQRRLRLGDIVDDYCPRERRVTNHAIVAMIEDDIKQTRCTTCDAEHPYKGGQAPRRRKAESGGTLYKAVLAGIAEPEPEPAVPADDMPDAPGPSAPITPIPPAAASQPTVENDPVPPMNAEPEPEPVGAAPVDEGPVHRQLIRAQLPRPEGMKVERTAPEFTIRQNGRAFRRDGSARGAGNGRGPQRFGHSHGQQRGNGGGGGGRGGQRFGGGRKRSR